MRSMTGFAAINKTTDAYDVFIEIKSVNSRYFEVRVKSSQYFNDLEMEIRRMLSEKLKRGKVEVFIKVVEKGAENYRVVVNEELAEKYDLAMRKLAQRLESTQRLSLEELSRLDGVLTLEREEAGDELNTLVLSMLNEALEKMLDMMTREGSKTAEDIEHSLNLVEKSVKEIEKVYPEALEKYSQSLHERIQEFVNKNYEENRLLMEIELVASRTAINEEVVRLKSHLSQIRKVLNGKTKGDAKKMDFIAQEMNRETNTIASKSSEYAIIENTILMKGEIEKIREQLRNLV